MFVRKKPNRSGSISVVVVAKKCGKVHYLKTIGVSCDANEIEALYLSGKKWIAQQKGERDMFLEQV
ncbi:MAG: transposase, partial [Bacteroidales bacterium]|nr:transposase [Bacteroidales bacterium]